MIFIPFYSIFPELARQETPCLRILEEEAPEGLPAGTYGLVDLYCCDGECDCRKAQIVFVSGETGREYGTIQYGWEDESFYNQFFGFEDHGLPGPSFPPMVFFGRYSDFFMDKFEELYLPDDNYTSQLKKHYEMLKKEAQHRDLFQEVRKDVPKNKTYRKSASTVKRNDRCPCGSGKKYKQCCLFSNR